jgi:hypothetical protein
MVGLRIPVAAAVMVAVLCTACAAPAARWIPYDQVHAKVRREIGMQRGQLVLACQSMVFVGQKRQEGSELDETEIASGGVRIPTSSDPARRVRPSAMPK